MSLRVFLMALASLALVVGALFLANVPPLVAVHDLLKGSLGSASAISGTLKETTPLLIAGLAVFIALKAGLFNIGVEGQLVMGAMVAAAIGLQVQGALGIVLGILGGALAGCLWAWPAGAIKAYRNGHEVITTIMLNNIARFLTFALVTGPLKDAGQESPTTAVLAPSATFPWVVFHPPFKVSAALVLGLAIVALTAFWLKRTVQGYELRATGSNPTAARFAGVNAPRVILGAMCVSGGVAGLAGALQVLAYENRFYDGFSPGYGFDALGVALLAGGSPYGLIPAAALFGILAQGSTSIQILGVPKGLTYVILGLLILTFAVVRYRKAGAHE